MVKKFLPALPFLFLLLVSLPMGPQACKDTPSQPVTIIQAPVTIYYVPATATFTHTPTSTITNTPTKTATPTNTMTPIPTDTPLCVSPSSFGKTTIGSQFTAFSGVLAVKATLSASATVVSLSVYIDNSGNGDLTVGIYQDTAGIPDTLLVQSYPTYVAGAGWKVIDIPDTYLTAGNYWLAFRDELGATQIAYDTGPANSSWTEFNYTSPFSSPFATDYNGDYAPSISAQYCP